MLTAKDRLAIPRQTMPARDGDVRCRTFDEVNIGQDLATIQREAERCLLCKTPTCREGCPVQVDIRAMCQHVTAGDLAQAANVLFAANALPSVTGRVCPQESQCEGCCVRAKKGDAVAVGNVERYVADWARANDAVPCTPAAPNGRKVAVVGSGPCGLTAACDLANLGYAVTVFEAFHTPGGVLVYGIPEFRLPKAIVADEVRRLAKLGVTIECNVVIGKTIDVAELRAEFSAVLIAVGAGLPVFMEVPGEDLRGVYSANEFLTRVNLMAAWTFPKAGTPVLRGRRVLVVGGGNVAMDAVRTARRLGAEAATIVYRRAKADMPARLEEVHHAEEEGVEFLENTAPIAVIPDGQGGVAGLRCVRMAAGEPDASGRRRPVPVPGSEHDLVADQIVVAIGSKANPLLTSTLPDLKLNKYGNIEIDGDHMTSVPGVFAGGDISRGAATVILAMGDGRKIATAIDRWCTK
jgi:glutamate synthase (NADPH/NADH) small chain